MASPFGSSFAGGPRHMIAEYQDAMAIVSKYGKPDVFLTFTCNPRWEEITVNLAPNQIASDRRDIVARVFNMKVKALCYELFKRKVLGEVSVYIYVIEFQKRGLAHMYMLITLKDGWNVNTAAQVNILICAELPCPTEDPELFDIVSKNMIHRSCGLLNPTPPCMKNGRRRDDGRFVMCRGTGTDNRFVVPYSPYLTRLFRAHINVETCSDLIQLYGQLPDGMIDSRGFHYFEMPEHFTYNDEWKERLQGTNTIGRMIFVAPLDSERFALRLLLLYGKSFTSFSDVLTVDAVQHPSFVAAARAAGYLSDDSYFEQSLREAATFHLPAQLRSFYVSLLIFGEVQPPLPIRLWEAFKSEFMEDYLRSTASTAVAESRAFYDIAARIESFGKEWRDYLDIDVPLLSDSVPAIDYDHHERQGRMLYANLNDEQKTVVDEVLTAIQRHQGGCYFVDGPGGSGKTFIYTVIYHLAVARRFKALAVAWTG
ncbi:unnamed protein product, partial [Heligmosomoides polygyrus]|uniref:ATP-dependent DNA helicase n=1 Tax=Heligmosomoides polygyrus TaxID=6339 RepID=A0A183GVS8_HELPZ